MLIDRNGCIVSFGKPLSKISGIRKGDSFTGHFTISRPAQEITAAADFQCLNNTMVTHTGNSEFTLVLRGQIEFITEQDQFLFAGSPWFGLMNQVLEKDLHLNDFALHDPVIDLLHVLKTLEMAAEDMKESSGRGEQRKARENTEPVLYDLSKLQKVSRGKEEFLKRMLGVFMETTADSLKEIRAAYSAGNFITLDRVAHRIRPGVENLGIHSIKEEMYLIEQLAIEDPQAAVLGLAIRKLEVVLGKITEEIKRMCA